MKLLILASFVPVLANATPSKPTPGITPTPPGGPQEHVEGDKAPKVPDDRVIRMVDFDLCWPANGREYQALGKHAVLMLTATSIFPSELPLASAYVEIGADAVPLRRIALLDPSRTKLIEGSQKTFTSQVSFYLLPIHVTKKDVRVLVDFAGERKGFSVTTLSKAGLDPRLPEPIRAYQHDSPGDPDMAALQALLVREYPDYFSEKSVKLDARAPGQ